MSIKLMSAAWDLDIPSTEKMVLMCLCDYADESGANCWPSVATLARKCSKSERTVQAAIRALEALDLVATETRAGTSNSFRLNPRRICTPAESAPRNSCTPPPQVSHPTPAESAPNPPINHQEPSEVKSEASSDRLTPADILEGWNDLASKCGLAKATKLTGGRLRQAKARLREYPDIEDWQRAFKHIHDTPFLRGVNDRAWRADLDFLLQAKSFTKLTEGSYGQQAN